MVNHLHLHAWMRYLRQFNLNVLRVPFIIKTTLRQIRHLSVFLFLLSCAPTLTWIPDSSPIPSCKPDRLLEWPDFTPRMPKDQRGAETAIRFLHDPTQHRLSVEFDHEQSWVRSELIDPQDVTTWKMSELLLAHEQLHFLISCLVVRQANLSITKQDDLFRMLQLTQRVAQQLNLQYDTDTNHGVKLDIQQSWESEVMRQFQELGPDHFPPTSFQEVESKKF